MEAGTVGPLDVARALVDRPLRPPKSSIDSYEQLIDRFADVCPVVADGDLDKNWYVIGKNRLGDGRLQSQCPCPQIDVARGETGKRELVATQAARRRHRARGLRKSASEFEEYFVAAGTTQSFVDLPEPRNVDQCHRRGCGGIVDGGRGAPFLQRVGETFSVQHARGHMVVGEVLQSFARLRNRRVVEAEIAPSTSQNASKPAASSSYISVEARGDVVLDRRVRQVHLKDADLRTVGADEDRLVDLHDARANRPNVVRRRRSVC